MRWTPCRCALEGVEAGRIRERHRRVRWSHLEAMCGCRQRFPDRRESDCRANQPIRRGHRAALSAAGREVMIDKPLENNLP